MIKIIFLCQILANELHTLAVNHAIFRPLKNKVKNLTPDLIRFSESHFDKLDQNAHAEMRIIYDTMDNFLNEISKVNPEDYDNLLACYKAMKKDPNSISGIVNKILK